MMKVMEKMERGKEEEIHMPLLRPLDISLINNDNDFEKVIITFKPTYPPSFLPPSPLFFTATRV